MCGIFGHIKPIENINHSRQALNKLKHRGPDQWGDWNNEAVYLGHRRLSIMDTSDKGRQPMAQHDIVLTVNGEIYNFKKLKYQLEKKYTFTSGSDSEVLIYGYLEWGIEKLLTRIEGMFSFVLYDIKKNKLYLARDRVGIKPMYYSLVNNQLAWASELKAITEFYKDEVLEVDYTAVYDYLTYRYIPTPKSLYKEIRKLTPAHYLEYDLLTKEVSEEKYWELVIKEKSISLGDAAKKVRYLVDKAVEEQLMSDVPVGFFLSGGMDSSTIVASASKFIDQINTYSIGFDIKEHDETHFAKIVADKFKTKHTNKKISVGEVKKIFNRLRGWYDEPFADTSAFPVYTVSKLAKTNSTVVLTGDGGDEVFGGYNWYKQFEDGVEKYVKDNLPKIKRTAIRLFAKDKLLDLEFGYYTKLMAGLTKEEKKEYKTSLKIPDSYDDYWYFRKFYRKDLPLFTRLQFMDFHTYLHDDILTKVDRASMAVALECRVPLLSTELIEFVFSVPEKIRYHGKELKGLMKYAFIKRLPKEIISRDKKGFSIPTGRWQPKLMKEKTSVPEFILEDLYSDIMQT